MESVQVPSCLRQGSKDTALCAKKLPPLNGSMVLSVSVARIFGEIWNRGFPNFSTAVDDRGLYRLIPFFSYRGWWTITIHRPVFHSKDVQFRNRLWDTQQNAGIYWPQFARPSMQCSHVSLRWTHCWKKLVATKTVIPNPSRNNDVQLIF